MNFRKRLQNCFVLLCLFIAITNAATAFANLKGTVNTNGAHIRSGPSTTKKILCSVKQGELLNISAIEDDWYKVNHKGVTGYIRADKLDLDRAYTIAFVVKDNVSMYSEANRSSEKIKTLEAGVALSIQDAYIDWYKVSDGSAIGYIRSKYISSENPLDAASSQNLDNNVASGDADEISSIEPEYVYDVEEKIETDEDIFSEETETQLTTLSEIPDDRSTSSSTTTLQSAGTMNVKEMQTVLAELGFYSGKEDGVMGTWSLAALKSFQRAYGIEVDGKLGEKSVESLRAAYSSGGNGFSAKKVQVSNGVVLAEWFNYMKTSFPKYESLRCVDVKTGKSFNLRAFSCGNHADVEPPTKEDTEKIYSINGSEWSWTPRPIWVYIDGVAYAAAINVKPHGPDTLPNNGMNGQICMHFLHSRTHNTGTENANMQKAVLEAFENAKKAP